MILDLDVLRLFLCWGSPAVLPIVCAIVCSGLHQKEWKVIADIVTDPKSAPEVFVTVLGSVCTSETRELLQKIVGTILRRKLVDRGIEHEDAEKLLQLLKDRLDLAQGFSSPQSAVQKLLTLFGELQG